MPESITKKKFSVAMAEINKKYGEGSLIELNKEHKINTEVFPTDIASLDLILGVGGIPKGKVMEIYGPESCLSKDTFIQYNIIGDDGKRLNHKGGSIENLFKRFNNIKEGKAGEHLRTKKDIYYTVPSINKEGYVFHNKVADVVKCGIKATYLLTTKLGNKLICTNEHKIYIGNGKYVPLGALNIGDTIYSHNQTPFKGRENRAKYAETTVAYHPKGIKKVVSGNTYFRIRKSRTVYEANLNKMSYVEFRKFLNSKSKKEINNLQFISEGTEVHHIDRDTTNDKIENLILESAGKHQQKHALINQSKLSFIPVKDLVDSIVFHGKIETYDIKCFAPNNNYIANGIVVHNSGKTTLALHILAQAHKYDKTKKVAFIDVENAFDPEYAKTIGIDKDRMVVNQPNSGEEGLDIVEKLCQTGQFSAIVIDSVGQLVPMAVGAKEIDGTANIGTTARLLSQTLPRLSNAARLSGTVLIFINQIRMKIGVMYGNPETTMGGLALKFACSVRIEIRGRKAEEKNGFEGIPTKLKIIKNKLAPPFRSTELFIRFGKGFDIVGDQLETALSMGLVKKSGGWYEYETLKAQGWDKFVSELLEPENKELYTKIINSLEAQN